jgi:hypothetical protein
VPRIVKKPGDILSFPLSSKRHRGYCQWLRDDTARVFLGRFAAMPTIEELLQLPIAFRVLVCNDTPNRYGWTKIGRAEIPPDCEMSQRYAMQDPISGRITINHDDVEVPATFEELVGLEVLAAWAHPHVVERLEAMLDGKQSTFLASVAVDPDKIPKAGGAQ